VKAQEVINWINAFSHDIEFSYNGVRGVIMPLSAKEGEENITLGYGDNDGIVCKSAEEVMAYPIFDGKSLNEICENVEFG
jgi:hypothetical protein